MRATDQLKSRLNFVINQDLSKQELGIKDYLNTFKKVNNKSFQPSSNFIEWDETSKPEHSPTKRRNDNHRSLVVNEIIN